MTFFFLAFPASNFSFAMIKKLKTQMEVIPDSMICMKLKIQSYEVVLLNVYVQPDLTEPTLIPETRFEDCIRQDQF